RRSRGSRRRRAGRARGGRFPGWLVCSRISGYEIAGPAPRQRLEARLRHTNPVPSAPMATVRLFARLRELAGSSRVEIEGATVGDVVAAAAERFGSEFAATLDTARVWLNGEEADPSDPVSPGDEIALLPPVSGGAATLTDSFQPAAVVPGVVALVLSLVNLRGDAAMAAAGVPGDGRDRQRRRRGGAVLVRGGGRDGAVRRRLPRGGARLGRVRRRLPLGGCHRPGRDGGAAGVVGGGLARPRPIRGVPR